MRQYTSPAKVNLRLTVQGQRPDGYHEIETLLQAIDIFDTLTFIPIPKGIEVLSDTSHIPSGEQNIVWRAAHLLFATVGYKKGIRVEIQKKIPVAAGLGGGSSNAATTLIALNEMLGFNIGKENLLHLGASLGADVPFFIFGKTAWARGVGEILSKADGIPAFNYLLINPGFPLSTREVYGGLKIGLTNKINNYSAPPRFTGLSDIARLLANDLESVSFKIHPQIGEIKRLLLENGACGALMSGSGPSVFGIFESLVVANNVAGKIAMEKGWRVFVVAGLNEW